MTATVHYVVPGDAPDPFEGRVGKTLSIGYGINGRLPERTVTDVIRSVKKHVAEVLDERGGEFLTAVDGSVAPSWEVRLWDEPTTFRFPFARVAAFGPLTSSGTPVYADSTQPLTVHLYPGPAQDSERAVLQADRLRGVITDAFEFGAGRGHPWLVPLWDFGAAIGAPDDPGGLYQDSEARQPYDFMRVVGLTVERLDDPEDDRHAWVVVNFRAQWRRVARAHPGHLVESLRVTAHPE